jgi:RecB family endonuclease NucS
LRDFIAQNISAIDVSGKRLRLYVDPTGRDGIEFPTAVGPIDILAVDDSGAFFVFELKRARSPDRAIGQLARYMGWVRQTIGRNQEVNGIIVAKEISDSLRYAVSVVPNVSLFEYEVEFRLKPAQDIRQKEGMGG